MAVHAQVVTVFRVREGQCVQAGVAGAAPAAAEGEGGRGREREGEGGRGRRGQSTRTVQPLTANATRGTKEEVAWTISTARGRCSAAQRRRRRS